MEGLRLESVKIDIEKRQNELKAQIIENLAKYDELSMIEAEEEYKMILKYEL